MISLVTFSPLFSHAPKKLTWKIHKKSGFYQMQNKLQPFSKLHTKFSLWEKHFLGVIGTLYLLFSDVLIVVIVLVCLLSHSHSNSLLLFKVDVWHFIFSWPVLLQRYLLTWLLLVTIKYKEAFQELIVSKELNPYPMYQQCMLLLMSEMRST